ncbi:MAG: prolyl oligopeptidase family serine peptidase, partial [Candidatus Obscuribacterales bacterium]|nr:prolyl oligopeptidase family serine peptidase [Candidatus Obscuribacterales bacterium]
MKNKTIATLTALLASTFALSAYIPGDNLHSTGIPSIPDSLVDEVNRYTEFRTASVQSWHPKQRQMLIKTRFADTQQVHHLNSPGAARKQLTFFKDNIDWASYQPITGDYFVFSKDSGGDENYQLHKFDCLTGDITMLTDGKSRNTGGTWSTKGDRIAYESNRRNKKDMDIYVMSPTSKEDKLLAEMEGGGFNASDWSPDDKTLLLTEEISINESYLWLLDLETGKKTLLTPKGKGEPIAYNDARFSMDGKGIYTACDKDSEFCRLTYIDLKTLKHNTITDKINWDVAMASQSWDGKWIAFVTNEDAVAKLHVIDAATLKEVALPELPKGQIGSIKWHRNNEDLAFVMDTARSPSDAYSFNIKSKKLDRWTESETGGLNTSNFSEPEVVHWKSFDGKEISGLLYLPPKKFTGKRPVLMIIHGGPEGQSTAGFMGKLNFYLNELGVAIIFPNVRGSAGYGKSYLKADNGFLREGSYKDIDALISWINSNDKLDAQKIMVT